MKALLFVLPLLLLLACNQKSTERSPEEALASAEASLATGQLDASFVEAQRTLAGLCQRGAAPANTALEAFVLRAETGTMLLLSAYLTQDPQLVALLTTAFGFTVGEDIRSPKAFQSVAMSLKDLAAVVLRRSGPDSRLALRASKISAALTGFQTIYFTKQSTLMDALASLDSGGPFERRLSALGHALLLVSFADQTLKPAPAWKYLLAGLLGPVCPKGVEPLGAVLCVPAKDPKVYGECEVDVAAIPLKVRQGARKALEAGCKGEGSALERASARFVAMLQLVAGDEVVDSRVRAWATQTLASDLPKLKVLEDLLPAQ